MKMVTIGDFYFYRWAATALINGDYSGCDDQDEAELVRLGERLDERYGKGRWRIIACADADDYEFTWRTCDSPASDYLNEMAGEVIQYHVEILPVAQ